MNRNAENGRGVMMRREAAAAVGPPDERYFPHCEGLDWCAAIDLSLRDITSTGMIQFLPRVLARDVSALADGSSNRGHLG